MAKNLVPLTSRFFRMPKKKTQADFRARRWAFFCQPFRPCPPQVVPGRQPKAKGMVPLRQVQVVDYRRTSLWCHTSEPYQTPVSDSRQQRNHIEEAKRYSKSKARRRRNLTNIFRNTEPNRNSSKQPSKQRRTRGEKQEGEKQEVEKQEGKRGGKKLRKLRKKGGKKRWEKIKEKINHVKNETPISRAPLGAAHHRHHHRRHRSIPLTLPHLVVRPRRDQSSYCTLGTWCVLLAYRRGFRQAWCGWFGGLVMSPSAELGGANEAAASSGAAASDGDHMSGATTGVPPGASLLVLDEFVLESGQKLAPCPVAYTTYGTLNSAGTNVVVVEHSLTSNSNVHEWWSPMLGDGPEFAIDTSQSFVFCANYLGSPYGTASPLTHKENSNAKGEPFPICTIRDNVRLQHTVLERLGMKNVKLCIGGSMGAMVAIEWACTYPELVTGDVVLIAGCGRHTAWAIALSEAQRFAIRGDAVTGLAAARMMAMLAYRAPSSIDDKFSRRAAALLRSDASTPVEGIPSPAKDSSQTSQDVDEDSTPINLSTLMDGTFSTERSLRRIRTSSWQNLHDSTERNGLPPMCSAAYDVESYLHHQGLKFVRRFDPECYVSLTLSMDTHDIGRAAGTMHRPRSASRRRQLPRRRRRQMATTRLTTAMRAIGRTTRAFRACRSARSSSASPATSCTR